MLKLDWFKNVFNEYLKLIKNPKILNNMLKS
jgi:hypothetical protein